MSSSYWTELFDCAKVYCHQVDTLLSTASFMISLEVTQAGIEQTRVISCLLAAMNFQLLKPITDCGTFFCYDAIMVKVGGPTQFLVIFKNQPRPTKLGIMALLGDSNLVEIELFENFYQTLPVFDVKGRFSCLRLLPVGFTS